MLGRAPIVPAIPLALSKPRTKSARPQPEPDVAVRAGDATVKAEELASVSSEGDLLHTTVPNGRSDGGSTQATSHGDEPVSRGSAPTFLADAPGATSPTDTASPSPARKDRFDIRSIKIPPAFIPSAEQHTPYSAHSVASSQTRTQHQQQQQLPHAHPVHSGASGIVFGGRDSPASSPAPPHSAGSAYAPPQYAPHSSYASHNYHASEPQMQRSYPPMYTQQPSPWAMRPYASAGTQPSYYHPHAHMPFRYPPRELFASTTPLPNGSDLRSRSGSHASSAAQDLQRAGNDVQSPSGSEQPDSAKGLYPEQKATAFSGQHRHFTSQQIQPQPPVFPHPDIATALENAESMRDHVLSVWLNPELADCNLQVVETEGDGQTHIEGHKIILARSSVLFSMIRDSESTESATLKTPVYITLKDQNIRVGHFSECLRYLYGGPLPRLDFYRSLPTNEDRMTFALGFIAAGVWLSIAAVAHRGVEIAASLLQWDNFPTALAFALTGGLGQAWPIDDGSEERVSTCSSDDSIGKPEAGGSPMYDPYSTGLLHRIIDFTVQNFPPNFYLDSTAPQLESCRRLPASKSRHQSRPSRSDPRLSKIRFGEIPVDDHQRPSFITTTISSIMLSLPFPLLKFLLEHPLLSNRLGPETVASIMRQVVNEREVRRQKALTTWSVGNDENGAGAEPQQIQNLYWGECVEQSAQHRAGSRLARRRRGIDTPPSSGTESEQVK